MNYIIENKESAYYKIIDNIIISRKKEVFDFFNEKEEDLSINIYIYNSIESLVLGLRERGFKKDPDYMCACFKDEDNSLNYFEPSDNPKDDEWSKEEYNDVIFHELIHAIQYRLFGTIPEWLSEGIAKYLDGSKIDIKRIIEGYIPKQEEIEYEFGEHDYDSYNYAYLMVSYLIDNLGKDKFIGMLRNKDKINYIKNNLLINAVNYYKTY